MSATIAERLSGRVEISDGQTGNDGCMFDRIVEVDSAEDRMAFIIPDGLMTLLVYLAPVVVFGCMVAPVVVRLLSMPVPH